MKREPTDSSSIKSVGFEQGVLEVEFPSGVYRYPGVPAALHEKLMAAESKGMFFSKEIRPNFKGAKVEPIG